jgi:hypothetical protein
MPSDAGTPHGAISRKGWTVTADSENVDVEGEDVRLANFTIDGNPNTWWHSNYIKAPTTPLPHHLDFNFGGAQHTVTGIVMWPRMDHVNGRIGKFEVYLSKNGSAFGAQPVAAGTWEDSLWDKVRMHGAAQSTSIPFYIACIAH